MPEISLVVPAYDAEVFLAETLDSVIAQSFPDWELVVVDDGSTDGTADTVRRYVARDSRIQLIEQVNSGVAAARNTGLFAANPETWAIMFLDADDVLERDALTTLSDALRAHPEAVGAHGQARFVDANGNPTRMGESEAWGRERYALVNRKIVP
jgi:glycosyltransferase involved in cell wall biosynthesis